MPNCPLPEKIFFDLVSSKSELNSCKQWLKNLKSSAHSQGLVEDSEEVVYQNEFVYYVLTFLRERAREIGDKLKVASSDPQPPVEILIKTDSKEYQEHFPSLSDSTQLPCPKSTRRITPTPIPKETDLLEGCAYCPTTLCLERYRYISYICQLHPDHPQKQSAELTNHYRQNYSRSIPALSKAQEERYELRFKSQRNKHTKKCYNMNSMKNNLPGENLVSTKTLISDRRKKMLNEVIELYQFLLRNCFVPNLSNEIKFILHQFYFLSRYEVMEQKSINDDTIVLTNINDWIYFCVELFIKLDFIFTKMDHIIKEFLHMQISNMKFIPASSQKSAFLEKLKMERHRSSCGFISFQVLCGEKYFELNQSSNFDSLESFKNKFLSIEQNWKEKVTDDLNKELEFLLSFKNDTNSLHLVGQAFLHSLMLSIEDSEKKKSDRDEKRYKLSKRMSKLSNSSDHVFKYNEIFYQLVIDFCATNCPILMVHIKFWIFNALKMLTTDHLKDYGDVLSPESRNIVISELRLKLILAKFLGYIEFYPNRNLNNGKCEESDVSESVGAEFIPTVPIKDFIIRAVKLGQLTDTLPWIAQYLCMASYPDLSTRYYRESLFSLVSINLSCGYLIDTNDEQTSVNYNIKKDKVLKLLMVIPYLNVIDEFKPTSLDTQFVLIKESSLLFIKLWIGKIFGNKNFGETLFFNMFNEFIQADLSTRLKGQPLNRKSLDVSTVIKEDAYLRLCSHFSKAMYWAPGQPLTSYKNIRPSLIDSCHKPPVDIQKTLQEEFLKDNKKVVNIIDFVSSHVFSIFQASFSKEIQSKYITTCSTNENENMREILGNQLKLLIQNIHIRATEIIKLLMHHVLNSNVHEISLQLCLQKLNQEIKEWAMIQGYEDLIKENLTNENVHIGDNAKKEDHVKSPKSVDSICSSKLTNIEVSVSEVLQKFSFMIWKLENQSDIPHDVNEVVKQFSDVLENQKVKEDIKLREEIYDLFWTYIIQLVITQPQLVSDNLLEKTSLLWKKFRNYKEINILCPLIVRAASLKDIDTQKCIAGAITKLIHWVMQQNWLSSSELEEQGVALLQCSWTVTECNFLIMTFANLKSLLIETKQTGSLSMIDCLSETFNAIKEDNDH